MKEINAICVCAAGKVTAESISLLQSFTSIQRIKLFHAKKLLQKLYKIAKKTHKTTPEKILLHIVNTYFNTVEEKKKMLFNFFRIRLK